MKKFTLYIITPAIALAFAVSPAIAGGKTPYKPKDGDTKCTTSVTSQQTDAYKGGTDEGNVTVYCECKHTEHTYKITATGGGLPGLVAITANGWQKGATKTYAVDPECGKAGVNKICKISICGVTQAVTEPGTCPTLGTSAKKAICKNGRLKLKEGESPQDIINTEARKGDGAQSSIDSVSDGGDSGKFSPLD